MTSNADSVDTNRSLPRPRLVLRVGGLGNRRFGADNGIAEDSAVIRSTIETTVEAIFREIEGILTAIHRQDRESTDHQWPEPLAAWKLWKWLPGVIMGATDRWGLKELRGTHAPVFTEQVPLVTVLTGGADGADVLLEAICQRPRTPSVEYSCLRVQPDRPAAVAEGLGIGSIPEKWQEAPDQAVRGAGGMPRSEAEMRARIARQRAFGFRAQSEALRHHSDFLIAIWDPHTEGKAGGTSESVVAALNERIPVLAVRVLGERLCDVRVLVSPEQLRALDGLTDPAALPSTAWHEGLKTLLTGLLEFPDPVASNDTHQHPADTGYHPRAAFQAFRSGKPLNPIWTARFWTVYGALSSYRAACHALRAVQHHDGAGVTTDNMAVFQEQCRAARSRLWQVVKEQFGFSRAAALSATSEKDMQEPTYASWYGRVRERASSSGMSGVYGDAHRGGILASYVLAAFAVMLAVLGGLLHHAGTPAAVLIALAVAELTVIVLMYSIADASKMEDWNMAWTESRILAEALRMMEHLGPLGVHTPLPRLPYYLRGSKETPEPDRMWSVWYFRALVRMAPLRLHPTSETGLEAHRKSLETLVRGQQAYHQKNASRQLAMHHDLEWISGLLFLLVFLTVVLHIVDIASHGHWTTALTLIVCVCAPALIAAMHGLASQIEITRLHQRSFSVATLLLEQHRRIEHLEITTAPESAETVWGYTTEVLSTASLLMDETAGWSMLYRNSDIHAG